MQQQSGTYAAQSSAMGVPGGGGEGSGRSSKGMTAAEYRAARRAGKLSPSSVRELALLGAGHGGQVGEGGGFNCCTHRVEMTHTCMTLLPLYRLCPCLHSCEGVSTS